MADIARFDNLVLTTVKTGFDTAAMTLNVNTATSPFNSPASAPNLEQRALIFTDDLTSPTKFEIIYYTTAASDGSGGLNLTGITRNAEDGGSLNSFSAGDYCYSAPTEGTIGGVDRLVLASNGEPAYIYGQSSNLDNNQEVTFTKGTDMTNFVTGVILLVIHDTGSNAGMGAMISYTLGTAVYECFANATITVGTTSEPGGSTDVAIWTSDTNTLHFKNRLGSTRRISLYFLSGGD